MPNEVNDLLQRKLADGREFRDMEVRALEDGDPESYVVEGYASTFNQPYLLYSEPGYRVDEQIDARAFDDADMSDVILQYNHEGRVFARTSNGTLSIFPDEHGLKIRALLGGTEIGRQLYQEIRGGYTTKMSFGFTVEKDSLEKAESPELMTVTRTILGIRKLYDVSAVSLPANDTTEIIAARNYGEGVINEVKEEIRLANERRARKEELLKEIMKEV